MMTGIFQILNMLIILGSIALFVLFIIVLIKLNKALNIWLEKNRKG